MTNLHCIAVRPTVSLYSFEKVTELYYIFFSAKMLKI